MIGAYARDFVERSVPVEGQESSSPLTLIIGLAGIALSLLLYRWVRQGFRRDAMVRGELKPQVADEVLKMWGIRLLLIYFLLLLSIFVTVGSLFSLLR